VGDVQRKRKELKESFQKDSGISQTDAEPRPQEGSTGRTMEIGYIINNFRRPGVPWSGLRCLLLLPRIGRTCGLVVGYFPKNVDLNKKSTILK